MNLALHALHHADRPRALPKTTVLAILGAVLSLSLAPTSSSAQEGTIDPTFGTAGIALTGVSSAFLSDNIVTVLDDGRVVLVGHDGVAGQVFVARFDATGVLDPGFGTGGIAYTGVSSHAASHFGVAIQDDGKILVGGHDSSVSQNFVARFDDTGGLDAAFGSGGVVRSGLLSSIDSSAEVAIQHDGKILLSGNDQSAFQAFVARFSDTGVLDGSFGTSGVARTGLSTHFTTHVDVALQSDGKILVSGRDGLTGQAFVGRFTPIGALDATYGVGGFARTSLGVPRETDLALAVQEDDRAVLAYHETVSGGVVGGAIRRFTTAGVADAAGSTGRTTVFIAGIGLALQPDGKILFSGHDNSIDQRYVARFDGSVLDASFGTGGIALPGVPTEFNGGGGLALQSNGRILLSGHHLTANEAFVARFEGAPTPDITVVSPAEGWTFSIPSGGVLQRELQIGNVGTGDLVWQVNEVEPPAPAARAAGYHVATRRPPRVAVTEVKPSPPVEQVAGARIELQHAAPASPHSVAPRVHAQRGARRTTESAIGEHVAGGEVIGLVLDDGTAENAVGGGSFLWLNRFTPNPADFPFALDEVQVPWLSSQVNLGETFDIYLWEDTDGDGDPGTGAVLVASLTGRTVNALDALDFHTFPPVPFTGPGDVLVGIVHRTAGVDPGEFPAALDQTNPAGRSWVGAYLSGTPPDPPPLPADGTFDLVDNIAAAGNFMIRAAGVRVADCSWVAAAPVAGTTSPGQTSSVAVVADATGLPGGTVLVCELRVESDDPDEPIVSIPVTLEVREDIATATAGVCYGSTGANDGGRVITIDPGTGAGTLVGDPPIARIPGIAINAAREIFAIDSSGNLYRIDATSGASIAVGGPASPLFLTALDFHPQTGVLYGVTNASTPCALYTIDPTSGIATLVGATPDCFTGLAFDPTTSDLYASVSGPAGGGATPDAIYRVDPSDGTGVLVGQTGIGGGTPDIHFDDAGNLFGTKGGGGAVNDLVAIDVSDGSGTPIGSIGFVSVSGLDYAHTVILSADGPRVPTTSLRLAVAPNPFAGVALITFALPRADAVRVELFDVSGRLVETLLDGHVAAGIHSLRLDGRSLSSSWYAVRVSAGALTKTRSVMFVR